MQKYDQQLQSSDEMIGIMCQPNIKHDIGDEITKCSPDLFMNGVRWEMKTYDGVANISKKVFFSAARHHHNHFMEEQETKQRGVWVV